MEAGGEERAEASLRIRHFHGTISPEEFATEIESKNIPGVFRGAVKGWKSISLWDPSNGGLDYMMEKVGPTAVVEAMMSNYEHIFNGDLRSHERVVLPFSAFIASCKSYLEQLSLLSVSSHMSNSARDKEICEETCSTSLDATDRLYLAQIPIYSVERKEHCSLQVLKEDIQTPAFIANKCISSINFWMNRARSRSSTHYDPHHNILCVVSGQKEVILWPPEACRFLYPMPIYGEASNHSDVSIEDPDLSVHARAKHMKEYSQKVILNVGDALFIPEGWFHQVDSSDLTVAVNFWWVSSIMSDMVDHMDTYYLRRILNRLVSKEMVCIFRFVLIILFCFIFLWCLYGRMLENNKKYFQKSLFSSFLSVSLSFPSSDPKIGAFILPSSSTMPKNRSQHSEDPKLDNPSNNR
ncbi:2-oxoglutarate (2OG) and Fe(II)-dependent oxygenase superfamily protein [Rhynchospora pubera]|uniref:2-oxoglutarate (2OG) and Fe(II)-dependent oxygenase superfamily protein n=1 Tax=Rhynchospora pubera TaxID=906938 RepID=A0AAV8D9B9_9POAL|nr:2-oxoglutarate (2OG) and Fe(II)-dependent oxygenase superfamily protein [Rhynchospora pubera]